MKKFLLVLMLLVVSHSCVFAYGDSAYEESFDTIRIDSVDMKNIWEKSGKSQQKIEEVGQKLLKDGKVKYMVTFFLVNDKKIFGSGQDPNAVAFFIPNKIKISKVLLNYIDNDDELAFILGHEIGHVIHWDSHKFHNLICGFWPRNGEYRADETGIDLMVKSGYNPLYAISIMGKISGDNWDLLNWTHPRGTKRMRAMYAYVKRNYPEYINQQTVDNSVYENFLFVNTKGIKKIDAKELKRAEKAREKEFRKNRI